MRRSLLRAVPPAALLAVVGLAIGGGVWAARGGAQEATPVAGPGGGEATLIVVERNDSVTDVDLGAPGASAGDLRVWGPNALYDEANTTDTGATTQGTCVALNAAADCLAGETVLFPDGSTIEIQGIQRGGGVPSTRTIVGGSGRYLGAAGTVTVAPTADETIWSKTFQIVER